jgi:hypothetical protein
MSLKRTQSADAVPEGGDGHLWDDTGRPDATGCICNVGGAWWCPVHDDPQPTRSMADANGCVVLIEEKRNA